MTQNHDIGASSGLLARAQTQIPAQAAGVIIVDLDQIAANWQALNDHVGAANCAAVVKADAYGLGAQRIIPALSSAGAETFFVATLDEARVARSLAPNATVYVLDGLMPGSAAATKEIGAFPVISTIAEAEEWAALAPSRLEPVPCALHVDTGLNRLGLSAPEIHKLAANSHLLDRLDVKLVMSHLACADEPHNPKNAQQLSVFQILLPLLPSVPLSIAASDGLMLGPNFHFEMVRPGYAIYGGQASPDRQSPVAPALEVHARVLQVRDVAPGQTIGYSATFHPDRLTRLAVIAAGYADGYLRHLSAADGETRGHVAIAGQLCPIVGRVSMDLITVDITDLEDVEVKRGQWAQIIGPHITIEDIGRSSGTIGYEVLTRLSPRFTRVYLGGPENAAPGA
ncbi:MAG: alanine racemase [Alphaproteobacteria bacterium]|nr:alanine racemase [Alphaproteobacteria bacterium]